MLRRRPSVAGSAPRSSVAISFGSPASESGVGRLDLNELLIAHPQAAFLMRIRGDVMRGAGVCDGDLALVDRAIDPVHGQVVIAAIEGELACRRYERQGCQARLVTAPDGVDEDPAAWVPGEHEPLELWGVVTHVVRPLGIAPNPAAD